MMILFVLVLLLIFVVGGDDFYDCVIQGWLVEVVVIGLVYQKVLWVKIGNLMIDMFKGCIVCNVLVDKLFFMLVVDVVVDG